MSASSVAQLGLVRRVYRSSLGKKYVMAITGLVLFAFVVVHMLGNLQVFLGSEPINAYAAYLKSHPTLLWSARIGLLVIVILHITAAIQLALENRAARPERYTVGRPTKASFASRTILASGLIILAFVVYHLLQFTIGVTNPDFMALHDPLGRHDVHGMMVAAFSNPIVSAFYMIAMGLLCLHLSHGLSSLFQSLGLRSRKTLGAINRFAQIAALVIFIGNSSIPLAILTGFVK
jgi:succinate dehydrogenase / fumarate reductase, cytochrome b subunit